MTVVYHALGLLLRRLGRPDLTPPTGTADNGALGTSPLGLAPLGGIS